ncbi:MAG: hypothetical protein DMF75_21135 [Acidobacteria bacterium]|nr:MAG: hypothetical protein DMF75_21135 [Acidobacteriota bacterium]
MMRTTLTLDDDVAAKLDADARRSGRSFKETVNHYLRLGLRPGLSLDNIGELIERIEGPLHK